MKAHSRTTAERAPWIPRVRRAAERERLARATVVVLYGGTSSEREVSLVSGRGILAALPAPCPGDVAPLQVIGVEIDATGRWIVAGSALEASTALGVLPSDALYFVGLHGGAGEDGRIQAFLEIAGRAYTGSGPAASALCMDKHLSRLAFSAAGLTIAPARTIVRPETGLGETRAEIRPPPASAWFVKPVHGGSSVGTRRVERGDELASAVDLIHASRDDALVECAIDGLEVTVGVVGNRASGIRALPLVEILPRRSPFFDYREKYAAEGAIELCPAQHLSPEEEELVAARACAAYRTAGCDGYARIDFVLPRPAAGSEAREPVVLEANTLPGFTPTSLLPKEAAAVGVGYRELCLEIAALGLERHRGILE
jgi:D-alanine-D-alanine ligase